MTSIRFLLALSSRELMPYYQGQAQHLLVRDEQGRVVRLHPRHIRPFVTAAGVRGRFELKVDDQGHFAGLERLS